MYDFKSLSSILLMCQFQITLSIIYYWFKLSKVFNLNLFTCFKYKYDVNIFFNYFA